jgi:drug/metabolite transporter (DMT)-like permease
LVILAYAIERKIPNRQDIPWFVLTGVVGVFLGQAFFLFGVKFAGASIASIMQLLAAPVTSLLAVLFKVEKIALVKFAGVGLSVLGAATLVVPVDAWFATPAAPVADDAPLPTGSAPTDLVPPPTAPSMIGGSAPALGIALLACQTVFGSLQIILQKHYIPEHYGPLTVAGGVTLISAPLTSILALTVLRGDEWVLEGPAIWAVSYAILVVAVVGFTLWAWAVKRTDGSIVAATSTFNPVVGVFLAVIFLGEQIHLKEILGALLIFAGFGVVSYQKWMEQKQAHQHDAPHLQPLASILTDTDKAENDEIRHDSEEIQPLSTHQEVVDDTDENHSD